MWDRLGLVEPFSFLLRSSFGLLWFRSHSNSQSKQAIVLVKLWAVAAAAGVASLHAPGAANKNFIGIVEVNNELPINPRPICGSTRLAFPGSFILALAQFVKPAPTATNVATYSVGLVWRRKLCMAVHNAGF